MITLILKLITYLVPFFKWPRILTTLIILTLWSFLIALNIITLGLTTPLTIYYIRELWVDHVKGEKCLEAIIQVISEHGYKDWVMKLNEEIYPESGPQFTRITYVLKQLLKQPFVDELNLRKDIKKMRKYF